ncbi:hypothetical protein WDW86_22255 [Bdellovibrionota bacterium FG-2]
MSFTDLNASQRWLYAGNLFLIAGTAAISIGHLLALVAEGRIPLQTQSQPGGNYGNTSPAAGSSRARDYFGS